MKDSPSGTSHYHQWAISVESKMTTQVLQFSMNSMFTDSSINGVIVYCGEIFVPFLEAKKITCYFFMKCSAHSKKWRRKLTKPIVGQKEITFLGLWLTQYGWKFGGEHLKCNKNTERLSMLTKSRSILDLVIWQRGFIYDLDSVSKPLHDLKPSKVFLFTGKYWMMNWQVAFDAIKEGYAIAPELQHLDHVSSLIVMLANLMLVVSWSKKCTEHIEWLEMFPNEFLVSRLIEAFFLRKWIAMVWSCEYFISLTLGHEKHVFPDQRSII